MLRCVFYSDKYLTYLDRKVSLRDIRLGKFSKEAAEITMVSATDGNHGRSLAWGCQSFGVPCKIYIHAKVSEERASAMKNYRCRSNPYKWYL